MTRKVRRDLLNSAAHLVVWSGTANAPMIFDRRRPSAPSGVRVEQREPAGTRFPPPGRAGTRVPAGPPRLSDPSRRMITERHTR